MVIFLTKYRPLVSTNKPEREKRISFTLKYLLNYPKHDGLAKNRKVSFACNQSVILWPRWSANHNPSSELLCCVQVSSNASGCWTYSRLQWQSNAFLHKPWTTNWPLDKPEWTLYDISYICQWSHCNDGHGWISCKQSKEIQVKVCNGK